MLTVQIIYTGDKIAMNGGGKFDRDLDRALIGNWS
jgi:hypothetical protein